MQPQWFTIVELSGHIIDSLTLAKVIDKIQQAGCLYQINDLKIGEKKNDVSSAQISLWAETEDALSTILVELKPHGALPVADAEVRLAPCPADGQLPEGAYIRLNPPMEIMVDSRWTPVERRGHDMVIVVDPATRTARLERAASVQKGEMVVMGKPGVKILPTLEAQANAQPVAG